MRILVTRGLECVSFMLGFMVYGAKNHTNCAFSTKKDFIALKCIAKIITFGRLEWQSVMIGLANEIV